jgi:hypothetical protein
MRLSRANLRAHVAAKDGEHARVRLGPKGTESSDGKTVYLEVPYPAALPFPGSADGAGLLLPRSAVDDAAKVFKSEEVEVHPSSPIDSSGPKVYIRGRNAAKDTVEVSADAAPGPWKDAPPSAPALGHVALSTEALERLLKAAKALDADVIKFDYSVEPGPTGVTLIDERGFVVARGLAMPVLGVS